jgi:hypothetical protein
MLQKLLQRNLPNQQLEEAGGRRRLRMSLRRLQQRRLQRVEVEERK